MIFFSTFLLYLVICFNLAAQDLETKIDRLCNTYITNIKAIKAEKNDEKAIAMMKKLHKDLSSEYGTLGSQLKSKMENMSEEDQKKWSENFFKKPYIKDFMEINMDSEFMSRIDKHPAMKKAFNDLETVTGVFDLAEKENKVAAGSFVNFTLTGGKYDGQAFSLSTDNLDLAEAFMEEGLLKMEAEGFIENTQVGISFFIEGDKPINYQWTGDYYLTLTLNDGEEELVLGGHSQNGSITVEKVENVGGWVTGKFAGKLLDETNPGTRYHLNGTFKLRRTEEIE